MAVDFGMRFRTRNGFWTPEGLLGITGAGGYRIEVAEESLPLLEPRVGDLASEGCHAGKVLAVGNAIVTLSCPERHNGKTHYCVNRSETFVIRRDGKPFFWPEVGP